MTQCLPTSSSPRAFTLLEVMIVVVIMGIVSFTVVPSLSLVREANEHAALREVERSMVLARSWAMATGRPTACLPDVAAGELTMWTLEPGAGAPSRALDALGTPREVVSLPARFAGVSISGVSGGLSHASGERLWFAFDGTPEVRDEAGNRVRALEESVQITLSAGGSVVVRPVSGLVERQP